MNAIERIKNQNLLQETKSMENSLQQKYQNSLKQIEELKKQNETLKSEKVVLEKNLENAKSNHMKHFEELKEKMKREREDYKSKIDSLRKAIYYVVVAGIIATLVAYFM